MNGSTSTRRRRRQLNIRADARLFRQWRDILKLQAAWDRRSGVTRRGVGRRVLAAALANYRNLLKKRMGADYRDAIETEHTPAKRTTKGPPPNVGLVRDYGPG